MKKPFLYIIITLLSLVCPSCNDDGSGSRRPAEPGLSTGTGASNSGGATVPDAEKDVDDSTVERRAE